MLRSYSKHLRVVLGLTGIVLGALAFFNLLADPYASFGLLSSTRLSHSAAGLGTRSGKAEMIVNHDWDVLLLGTSRVQLGLDPAHPAFAGQRVYNAGLSSADFPELDRAARFAIKRGTLKRLILCPDLFCFDPEWQTVSEVQQSLLNPDLNPVEYRLINLLSPNVTENSWKTVCNAWHNRDGDYYPLGRFANVTALPHRDRSAWVLGGFFFATVPPGARKSETWSLSQSRFDALARLLDDAGRAGVRVDVVHLPMHAICLERYFATDRWSLYEKWITALTGVVARHNREFPGSPVLFRDFATYHSLNMNPAFSPDRWFLDPFHFKVDMGNLVIDRIMQIQPPAEANLDGFGIIVTEANLQSHLEKLRHDHQAYYDGNTEVRRIHEVIRADRSWRGAEVNQEAAN